jgi:predicted PolB exonuclease-like 3'-5' exonuclease
MKKSSSPICSNRSHIILQLESILELLMKKYSNTLLYHNIDKDFELYLKLYKEIHPKKKSKIKGISGYFIKELERKPNDINAGNMR